MKKGEREQVQGLEAGARTPYPQGMLRRPYAYKYRKEGRKSGVMNALPVVEA